MEMLRKIVDKILGLICITLMSAMVILVTWQVITRYVFNNPSTVTEQLAQYIFVWLAFVTSAYVFGKREHMSIVFIKDLLPLKVKIVVDMIGELCVMSFAAAILTYGGRRAMLMTMKQLDSALRIPMGYIYFVIPLSGSIILFYGVSNLLRMAKSLKRSEEVAKWT